MSDFRSFCCLGAEGASLEEADLELGLEGVLLVACLMVSV